MVFWMVIIVQIVILFGENPNYHRHLFEGQKIDIVF